MPSKRRLARQGSAVVLSSFLVATSMRVAADKPSGERLAKAFRDRKPRDIRELLRRGPEGFQEARESFLAEHGGVPPWRRGRQGQAPDWSNRLNRRFHAGGLSEVDPEPVNPLLDPLGLFEDEAGEEPPLYLLPRVFLADFDGDGDLDVFAGDKYGYVRYLENVGSATDPVYEERTGGASPTGALDLSCDDEDPMETFPCGPSAPALADLDGDGDLDLFVGQGFKADYGGSDGRVLFFENDGYGNLARNDAANPFDGFVFGEGFATPTFVDVDGDDDLDAFVGTKYEVPAGPYSGEVYFLRNDGDDENPMFSDQTDVPGVDPFAGEIFFPFTAPFFANVDGDGDLDAFIGDAYKVRYFENDTVLPGPPIFTERTGYDHPLGDPFAGLSAPVFGDVDGDGDLDAFIAHGYGKFEYAIGYVQFFENTGTPTDPGFLSPGDRLELVDVDGDGDLDALVSHLKYTDDVVEAEMAVKATGDPAGPIAVWYYENVGTLQEPSWQLRTGLDNPFCTFNESYSLSYDGFPSLAATVGNLDGDALLDAVVGLPDGTLAFLEDDGSGQLLPVAHPLDAIDFGESADPQLVDVNGDGELDLVVGYGYYDYAAYAYYGRVALFLNPTGPDGLDAPPDLVLDFGEDFYRPAPVMADLDGDGDLDMLVGGFSFDTLSQTLFLENTGTLEAPAFDVGTAQQVEALVSTPNSPAVGDVNGDGFPDLFIGNLAGVEFFLTESALLEVTKEITGGTLLPNGTVQYTIVITNVGTGTQPDDADDPEFTDTLPPELTLTSAVVASGPGSVSTMGNTVRYDGAIGVGESATIVVEASIAAGTAGTTIENQGAAFFDVDGDGENDTEEPSDDPTTGAVDDPTAFVVGSTILDPAEVPTLSQWGSMLFAGLLSLLGLFGLRRFGG